MIIHSLIATNLLKYRHLELKALPTNGIIAISGYNESGKSSIGEAICFALFGRTFAIGPNEITKLISWGENHCSVTIELRLQNSNLYRLSRSLDRDHNHSARLSMLDVAEHTIARGKEAVAEAIQELIGYEFDAFIDSFYLAQREITTPHPHGHAIHAMAGIIPLTLCQKELQEEIIKDEIALAGLTSRNAQLKVQLTDLAFDSQRAHVLAADQTDVNSREQDIRAAQEALVNAGAEYQKRKASRIKNALSENIFAHLRSLSLVAGIISLGCWWGLTTQTSDSLSRYILELIRSQIDPSWLAYGAIISFGIFILSWLHVAFSIKQETALHIAGTDLADTLAALDDLEIGLPRGLKGAFSTNDGILSKGRLEPDVRLQLRQHFKTGKVKVLDAGDAVAREHAWLEQLLSRINRHQSDIYQEMNREKEQRQMLEHLTNMENTLKHEEAEIHHRIQVRNCANELLQGAVRHLSRRFNHHLRGLAGRTLPMFTENRYQHLQINEDLTVRAFSNEKRDFMELDEVSSGTQRQIMLALRLSMSQQLVNRIVKGKQFIFLDEPFAFFDEHRTRSALTALPHLSDDITQIWIVAQQFPQDITFAKIIQCRRDIDEYCDAS